MISVADLPSSKPLLPNKLAGGLPKNEKNISDLPEKSLSGVFAGSPAEFQEFCFAQGISIIFGVKCKEDKKITLDVAGSVPASIALKQVASQFDTVLTISRRTGNVYYLGLPDESTFISRVYWVSAKEATSFSDVAKAIMTSAGKVGIMGDTIVITDAPDAIKRIDKLYNSVMGARGQYCVEVRFVELTESGSKELGVDWNLAGSVRIGGGVDMHSGSETIKISDVSCIGEIELEALLAATESTEGAKLLQIARLHCIEGQDASIEVGDVVPVPQKTVSNEGTVTTSGYTYVQTGLIVNVSVRSEPGGLLRVYCKPELSQISRYVDDSIPVKVQRTAESCAVIADGGCFVLGGYNSDSLRTNKSGFPGLQSYFSNSSEKSRLFIVVRVVKAGNSQSLGTENTEAPLIKAENTVENSNTEKLGFYLPDEPVKLTEIK